MESFSAKLGSEPRHDFPYAGIRPDRKKPDSYTVVAKKTSCLKSKGILDFDRTNTTVTYLSKTAMKTMSHVVVHATEKLEFLLCGFQFRGSNEATKFFNEYLKEDCTKFLVITIHSVELSIDEITY